MTERDPERMIRRLFRFVDKPVHEEEDVADRVERGEIEARRRERDADFEVMDDLEGIDEELEDVLEGP